MDSPPLFCVKMRASAGGAHVSGAERVVPAAAVPAALAALGARALAHPKGEPDEIHLRVEPAGDILRIPALPVVLEPTATAAEGMARVAKLLAADGIRRVPEIMALFRETYAMRGAMLLDADTLERLEPDRARGVRATRMDVFGEFEAPAARSGVRGACGEFEAPAARSEVRGACGAFEASSTRSEVNAREAGFEPVNVREADFELSNVREANFEPANARAAGSKNHFREAIVLASKVQAAPGIVAEICVSDDPDYVTGYVASKSLGYRRIATFKERGDPSGGRIFLFRGPRSLVPDSIRFLQEQTVLVEGVPAAPPV